MNRKSEAENLGPRVGGRGHRGRRRQRPGRVRPGLAAAGRRFSAAAAGGLVERFDRRGTEPFELYRARSRPYRNEILQENIRLKALAEIYTMRSFAQLCNLKFLSKIAIFFGKFCKLQQFSEQNF